MRCSQIEVVAMDGRRAPFPDREGELILKECDGVMKYNRETDRFNCPSCYFSFSVGGETQVRFGYPTIPERVKASLRSLWRRLRGRSA